MAKRRSIDGDDDEEAVLGDDAPRIAGAPSGGSASVKPTCRIAQLRVMLWKQWLVRKRSRSANLQIFLLPTAALLLCYLFYISFNPPDRDSTGFLELIFVPIGLVMLMNTTVVALVVEKSEGLVEHMRIMSLKAEVYYAAYALEGLVTGLFVALVMASLSKAMSLFNSGDWLAIFLLLWVFCFADTAMSFLVAAMFDSAQSAGQFVVVIQGVLIALFFFALGVDVKRSQVGPSEQTAWTLLPHLALQLGVNSFRDARHPRPKKSRRFASGRKHYTSLTASLGCNRVSDVKYAWGCPELEEFGITNYDDDAWFAEEGRDRNETGTFKRSRERTQYDGIKLNVIVWMLLADVFIYCALAYYAMQTLPSNYGVRKPWYFPIKAVFPTRKKREPASSASDADVEAGAVRPREEIGGSREAIGGPTVVVRGLRKVFGSFVAVDDLCLEIHEGEIFALLGHNGAGKSTAINVLTGLLPSDSVEEDGGATVYGAAIRGEMDAVRRTTGLCPQHDVLFGSLTAREHLVFFASLKGSTSAEAGEEAATLLEEFHLTERADHLGHELSGGQRRKLAFSVALCGRSKFVLLDEPTAGMDPLARREFWGTLRAAKKGRAILLTTHYMDEADVMGDVVGIMSQGKMCCMGSSAALKKQYGTGYRLVCERRPGSTAGRAALDDLLLEQGITNSQQQSEETSAFEVLLPLEAVRRFGCFFEALEARKEDLGIESYGLSYTTLEDVFAAVGGDATAKAQGAAAELVGALRLRRQRRLANPEAASCCEQIIAVARKRLATARNDPKKTAALLLPPAAAVIVAFIVEMEDGIAKSDNTAAIFTALICAGGFLIYPALVAEQIVMERERKLRMVLALMGGCRAKAYWLGSLLGDFSLYGFVLAAYWIVIPSVMLPQWLNYGAIFYLMPIFGLMLIAYSYLVSWCFTSATRCITVVPGWQVLGLLTPQIIILVAFAIIRAFVPDFSFLKIQGGQYWLLSLLSPQGALWLALLDTAASLGAPASYAPRFYVIVILMCLQAIVYLELVRRRDRRVYRPLPRSWPTEEAGGDVDVRREKEAVCAMQEETLLYATLSTGAAREEKVPEDEEKQNYPLVVKRLRKVFLTPKRSRKKQAEAVVAVHEVSFRVAAGECFGLLGANGAGKTTVLNAVIRDIEPTSGDIYLNGRSVLDDFQRSATSLGVVLQSNTLWDHLCCKDHLLLMTRLRGVPKKEAIALVDAVLDHLELRPHARKLAKRLSGGMKRKLCVALAIIADPKCCLLDEPSAGLDPVSRRNLWAVLRGTAMSSRAVVLTSHLMEEVEYLCDRLSIMVQGKMRCLGTTQHLKRNSEQAYDVVITTNKAADPRVDALMQQIFNGKAEVGDAAVRRGSVQQYTYKVPQSEMRPAACFSAMEEARDRLGIEDYSLTQPRLEAVFIETVLQYTSEENTTTSSSEIVVDAEQPALADSPTPPPPTPLLPTTNGGATHQGSSRA